MILFVLVLICGISLSKEQCWSPCGGGVTRRDRKTIIVEHNNIRTLCEQGKIPGQPRGCNLMKLKYDKQLGKKAQEIADKCVFRHFSVKDDRWYWVGQNLFMSMNFEKPQIANWTAPVRSWYSEYKDYRYPDDSGSGTGHYTQLVWADTQYVGCGYKCFKHDGWYSKLYVCNYGPAGNNMGRYPYAVPDRDGSCLRRH